MKFCPTCNDRMSGELCTTCDKDKLPKRIKFSDYSNQKINSCDKGCGGKIYFDEDFRDYNHEGSDYFSIGGDRIYIKKVQYHKKILQ